MFADGGSRGNPGPAAYGAVIFAEDGTRLAEAAGYLGIATNNVAEWTAIIEGARKARELGVSELAVRMDSELVVKQLSGAYRVKHPNLIPLHRQAQEVLRGFARVDVQHVRRAQNADADALVNRVLDEARS